MNPLDLSAVNCEQLIKENPIDLIVSKRILFSPLNWGYGHLSRSIELLRKLRQNNNEVWVACSPNFEHIYCQYFSDLNFVEHDDYPFDFSGSGNFSWELLRSSKSLYRRYCLEKEQVSELVESLDIDYVLSDHRYGFRCNSVPSIFITHQINLPVGKSGAPLQWLHKRLLRHFDKIWLVDDPEIKLSGKLTQTKMQNTAFIGVLSRFIASKVAPQKPIHTVVLISGPEPYSEMFFKEQVEYWSSRKEQVSIVYSNSEYKTGDAGNLHFHLATDWVRTDELIRTATKIVSRSGYSTLMDIHRLNVEAELYPTPGQKEQIYLARRHKKSLD